MNDPRAEKSRRRRAVALLVAISVLAILTILAMGLAASHEATRHATARSAEAHQARQIARMGFDAAWVVLTHAPEMILGQETPLAVEAGQCTVQTRLAEAGMDLYEGKFLSYRPGDTVVTITASLRRGARVRQVVQTYLVNTDPARPRRVLLSW